MSIDERLAELTERNEFLVRSLELLARTHADFEKRFEEHAQRTDQRLAQLMDSMSSLANIVASHEQRLDDLEGRR